MEELIQLTRENNMMLKAICKYILALGTPQERDNKTLSMNMFADGIFYLLNQMNNGKSF